MDSEAAAEQIRAELRTRGTAERAASDRRYLKSDREHWGCSVVDVRAAVRRAGRPADHDDLIGLALQLWRTGPYDPMCAAAVLLETNAALLRPDDLPLLEGLLRQARTWALVDVLAPRPLAAIDELDRPGTTAVLAGWVGDPDFWIRRSALLAHLVPLRTGLLVWDRFAAFADELLDDREFFVRKAMGWVLRTTARHDPQVVADWVRPRTDRMSGVALREAVKPLPEDQRAALLAAYREGRAG